MARVPFEVKAFAEALNTVAPRRLKVGLGELVLSGRAAELTSLNYNKRDFELLQGALDYLVDVGSLEVELSVQLYKNARGHYRLFAFTRCGTANGMTFSLNLTTSKDAKGIVFLSQKIRFAEGRDKEIKTAQSIRATKARILADILFRCGVTVTDNLEVELGTFSSRTCEFLDTTATEFLDMFLAIALVKGHFQGNKGYQICALPRFDDSFVWKWDSSEELREQLAPNRRGGRGIRTVPLALRYQVLARDRGICCLCGTKPGGGVVLHVDHIRPFSLGGLSILSNLQTLCNRCNLGKGARYSTDHRAGQKGIV